MIPGRESIAKVVRETGMDEMQAIRHLQQRHQLAQQGRNRLPRTGWTR